MTNFTDKLSQLEEAVERIKKKRNDFFETIEEKGSKKVLFDYRKSLHKEPLSDSKPTQSKTQASNF